MGRGPFALGILCVRWGGGGGGIEFGWEAFALGRGFFALGRGVRSIRIGSGVLCIR